MAWWPSLWTNLNIHQDVLGTVDRMHLLPYSHVLMPISFLFSQEPLQTGTPFPVQPDQHHLWTPSRRPCTVYLTSPIVITEPCHSSSKGCRAYSKEFFGLHNIAYFPLLLTCLPPFPFSLPSPPFPSLTLEVGPFKSS